MNFFEFLSNEEQNVINDINISRKTKERAIKS